ncbi:MAG: cytochrome c biogenesis CcdA family protein [Candidatus Thorarchaeota archaeon]
MQDIFGTLIDLLVAFFSGFYVAISPCLFPMLPLFLMRTLQSEDSRRRRVLVSSTLIMGILVSLAVFAAIAVFIGLFLIQNHTVLQAILGGFIVFFGILTISDTLQTRLGVSSLNLKTPPTNPTGLIGVFSIGLGYSLMAAPCAAPLLFGVFLVFSTQTNVLLLLLMYVVASIGVAIPYLTIAFVTGEARTRMMTMTSENARKLEIMIGALFVIVGVILILPFFGVSFY